MPASRVRRPARRALLTTPLLLVLAACGGTAGGAAPAERIAEGDASATFAGGLRQRVTLVPATLVNGRDVEVRSVLVNTGPAAVDLTHRICGLDYEGTLTLTWPPEVLKCAGYSGSLTLAPGDSIVGADLMRVASPAGQYTLRVRHAISPDRWITVPVVVRAP